MSLVLLAELGVLYYHVGDSTPTLITNKPRFQNHQNVGNYVHLVQLAIQHKRKIKDEATFQVNSVIRIEVLCYQETDESLNWRIYWLF